MLKKDMNKFSRITILLITIDTFSLHKKVSPLELRCQFNRDWSFISTFATATKLINSSLTVAFVDDDRYVSL